eukprot:TRINITY_DN94332_c0_g1_i1.p1 TRINITY_DN94332_c0_g1~~TRINITY_DN94332_c0_g1_i1.p1  ORF type:complete len:437 (-),score=53.10 TRINITY_DN94332_c0_g1_i1:29-1339(-)
MDGPWPGYLAHIAEHFVALGQLRLQQLQQALEVGHRHAGQQRWPLRRGQPSWAPVAQQLVMIGSTLASGWCALMFCRACVHCCFAAARMALSTALLSASMVSRLVKTTWPWLATLAVGAYVERLRSCSWLRQEWLDYMQQWGWLQRLLFLSARSSSRATVKTCPICAEDVHADPWHLAELPCCGQVLCWACLRRHAESVVDDARPDMRCPLLPCKAPLPDTIVKTALRREQWSLSSLDPSGRRTARKRRAYERWSLSSGLAAACAARVEDVVHCPGGDCSHMWLLPKELRRRKSSQEPGSCWDPRSWAVGRHVGLYTAPAEGGVDGRCVHCPRCKLEYCLLCSQVWQVQGCSHAEKSCLEYDANLPAGQHLREKQWAGAKACPGCGVRTLRSMGCNHMTCTQCGAHWCWVCCKPWEPWHYGCTQSSGPAAAQCLVM